MAEFFAVFGNSTRLRIFCALQEGPRTVSELSEYAEVTLQNVSQHLRLMRDKGAVTAEKRGQHVYYTVTDPRFVEGAQMIRAALIELLQRRVAVVRSDTEDSDEPVEVGEEGSVLAGQKSGQSESKKTPESQADA